MRCGHPLAVSVKRMTAKRVFRIHADSCGTSCRAHAVSVMSTPIALVYKSLTAWESLVYRIWRKGRPAAQQLSSLLTLLVTQRASSGSRVIADVARPAFAFLTLSKKSVLVASGERSNAIGHIVPRGLNCQVKN